jgi:hypothetical protein
MPTIAANLVRRVLLQLLPRGLVGKLPEEDERRDGDLLILRCRQLLEPPDHRAPVDLTERHRHARPSQGLEKLAPGPLASRLLLVQRREARIDEGLDLLLLGRREARDLARVHGELPGLSPDRGREEEQAHREGDGGGEGVKSADGPLGQGHYPSATGDNAPRRSR